MARKRAISTPGSGTGMERLSSSRGTAQGGGAPMRAQGSRGGHGMKPPSGGNVSQGGESTRMGLGRVGKGRNRC